MSASRAPCDAITSVGRAVRPRRRAELLPERGPRGTPPRDGCAVEVLVDGALALPRSPTRSPEPARTSTSRAGTSRPASPSVATERPVVLRNLLAEVAERADVRVLAWAGAPLPVFRPSRRERPAGWTLCRGHPHPVCARLTRAAAALPPREDRRRRRPGRVRRRDRPHRRERRPLRLEPSTRRGPGSAGTTSARASSGPRVADVAAHFRMRWREVTGEALPASRRPTEAGGRRTTVQIVRTIPERIYDAVPGRRLRDPRVVSRRAAVGDVVRLPREPVPLVAGDRGGAAREARAPADRPTSGSCSCSRRSRASGADDTRGHARRARRGRRRGGPAPRLHALRARGRARRPVYVHAKVGIVDDRWLTIGSANLNEHSLFNDTEMNVVTHDERLARSTRLRLWAEHLELAKPSRTAIRPRSSTALAADGGGAAAAATSRLCRSRTGSSLLPGVSARSGRLLGPLQGLLVDG